MPKLGRSSVAADQIKLGYVDDALAYLSVMHGDAPCCWYHMGILATNSSFPHLTYQ